MLVRSCGVLTLGLTLLTGCGPSLKLVPVEGTITLDGNPLANKSLSFAPESGSGTSGGGNTDASGKYKLLAVVPGATTDQLGIPPGKYKVTVFEPLIPIDQQVEEGTDSDPGPGLVPEKMTKSKIPLIYQHMDTTPLVIEVPEGGGTLNLALKSSGGDRT